MSEGLVTATRRALGRVVVAFALLTGIVTAIGAAPAGATIATLPATWGTVNYPAGLPNYDCGNEFAVDAAGNIYTMLGNGGDPQVQRYAPGTGVTVTFPFDFGSCSHFTVDASGDVYVSNTSDGNIYQISTSGNLSLVTSDTCEPGPLATDAAGHVFFYDYCSDGLYQIEGGVPVLLNTADTCYANSIAVAPDGSVYVADYCSGDVWRVTSTSVTSVGSFCDAESVAVDSAGNLYVADDCDYSSPMEIPSGGSQGLLTPPLGSPGVSADEVFFNGATLYFYDTGSNTTIYTLNALTRPPLLSVVSSLQTSPLSQTDTATWHGVPGAISYTCTLMYGFTAPSTFTVTTPSTTCSFGQLDPTTEYGIQVVANFNGESSGLSVGFATPAPLPTKPPPPAKKAHSIVCQKTHGTALRVVTAVSPRCPRGWHRVG